MNPIIKVIIPAFNEQDAIGKVISEIPQELVNEIIVVNNGSTDQTALVARQAGTTILEEPIPGYGNACLKGIHYVSQSTEKADIIVFIDGDHSDYPEEMALLIEPITNGGVDLVIGSRALGNKEKGSMTPQQIFGNWLATRLLRLIYNARFTDLGPFRAIRYSSLLALDMQDRTFGWTVEMQVKAAKQKLRFTEVPVRYRQRIGFSKISGTIRGTILAGYKILYTIFKYV